MPVNVVQWRVEIGVFDALCDVKHTTKFSRSSHSPSKKATVTFLIFTLLLLFMSGDIELADMTSRIPHFMLLLGDFNAKSNTWFINDESSSEGAQFESLTPLYGMKQLIAEPTHVLENSSSCIGLFYTNQPNLIMGAGVHPPLHSKCYHQVIYAKLNL